MTDPDSIDKLREILDRVVAVAMPAMIRTGRRPPEGGDPVPLTPAEKIAQLESYLLLTAEARALAHQALVAASDELHRLNDEAMDGDWENFLNGSKAKATQPQIEEAKRMADPEAAKRRRRLQWIVRQFGQQIKRLEQDDAVASRAYTFITGG